MSDRAILLGSTFLRALATGMAGVLIGLYLARLGLSPGALGGVIAAGLAGAAVATLVATLAAERIGRRRILVAVAFVSAAGGVAVALVSDAWALGAASFLGMVNGMGRDRGAALVVEQAILPATTTDAGRTRAFAWYNVLQDVGHALGGLAAAIPGLLRRGGMDDLPALRVTFGGYAVLLGVTGLLALLLSPRVEAPASARVVLRPESRRALVRIASLFAVDSLAGGFLTTALVSFFFFRRFGVDEAVLGPLFFGARVMNAFSHLGAAWLAARIGLVNTMVFTHIPSSLLLVTVAFASSFAVAAALLLVREGLVEMDVPTRQSYVMALVRPEERTFASGVTHLVRVAAWAVAPSLAGLLMQGVSLAVPLLIGSGMKIGYDLALWRSFRRVLPPEEQGRTA